MKIVIAGGSGFLGTALTAHLISNGTTSSCSRGNRAPTRPAPHLTYATWTPDGKTGPWAKALAGAGAVVNLAGESIAARRWSPAQKERLRQSRLLATRSLTAAIRAAQNPPPVFVSGSAVGYYGDRGEETLTEASAPGSDFLAGLCQEWEAAAADAAAVTRVAFVRTGIVLDRREGALAKMLLPFRLFAGGPAGVGPSIHAVDPQGGLGAAGRVDHSERRRARPRERHGAHAGDQCRVLQGAGPCAAPAQFHAGAGVCPAARAWAKWPMRCCSAASARCPCARQISVFVVQIQQCRRSARGRLKMNPMKENLMTRSGDCRARADAGSRVDSRSARGRQNRREEPRHPRRHARPHDEPLRRQGRQRGRRLHGGRVRRSEDDRQRHARPDHRSQGRKRFTTSTSRRRPTPSRRSTSCGARWKRWKPKPKRTPRRRRKKSSPRTQGKQMELDFDVKTTGQTKDHQRLRHARSRDHGDGP